MKLRINGIDCIIDASALENIEMFSDDAATKLYEGTDDKTRITIKAALRVILMFVESELRKLPFPKMKALADKVRPPKRKDLFVHTANLSMEIMKMALDNDITLAIETGHTTADGTPIISSFKIITNQSDERGFLAGSGDTGEWEDNVLSAACGTTSRSLPEIPALRSG